jgi:hypothetical protein
MLVMIKNERNDSVDRESRDGNIEGVIAKRKPVFTRLIFEDRLVIRAKDFCEQVHARLREKDSDKTEPKGIDPKRFAQIISNARAKEVCERGEEQM